MWMKQLKIFTVSGVTALLTATVLIVTWKYAPGSDAKVRDLALSDWLPSITPWLFMAFCLGANLGGFATFVAETRRSSARRKIVDPQEWAKQNADVRGLSGARLYLPKPSRIETWLGLAALFWMVSLALATTDSGFSGSHTPSFQLLFASLVCGYAALLENRQEVVLSAHSVLVRGLISTKAVALGDIRAVRLIRMNAEGWRIALVTSNGSVVSLPADILFDHAFIVSIAPNPERCVSDVGLRLGWVIRQALLPRVRTIEQSMHAVAKAAVPAQWLAFAVIVWASLATMDTGPWFALAAYLCGLGLVAGACGLRAGVAVGAITCLALATALWSTLLILDQAPWRVLMAALLLFGPSLVGGLRGALSLERGFVDADMPVVPVSAPDEDFYDELDHRDPGARSHGVWAGIRKLARNMASLMCVFIVIWASFVSLPFLLSLAAMTVAFLRELDAPPPIMFDMPTILAKAVQTFPMAIILSSVVSLLLWAEYGEAKAIDKKKVRRER